jgi:site-specific recombinase XerD
VQYLRFHKRGDEWRHPSTLGAADIEQFLTALAVQRHVSASTQNEALGALVFLYRDVLRLEAGDFAAVRARRPKRVPLVLSPAEVRALLAALDALPATEPYGLMGRLMYGAGLRLME